LISENDIFSMTKNKIPIILKITLIVSLAFIIFSCDETSKLSVEIEKSQFDLTFKEM